MKTSDSTRARSWGVPSFSTFKGSSMNASDPALRPPTIHFLDEPYRRCVYVYEIWNIEDGIRIRYEELENVIDMLAHLKWRLVDVQAP